MIKTASWLLASLLLAPTATTKAPGADDERPAHHGEDGFRNIHGKNRERDFGIGDSWRMMRKIDQISKQAKPLATERPDAATLAAPAPTPRVTWLGHATALVQYRDVNILTDPVFAEQLSPLGGMPRITPPPVTLETLPPIHMALISHDHYDHLHLDTVRRLGDATLWFVPRGVGAVLRTGAGIAAARIVELDWWETYADAEREMLVTAAPALHWSARGPFDRNRRLWASWHVEIADFALWYSGDTGYTPQLARTLAERLPAPDLAIIPIGAYLPRAVMRDTHASPDEAVQLVLDLNARFGLGAHWGTYVLSAEPFDEPPRATARALAARGLPPERFLTPPPGAVISLQ